MCFKTFVAGCLDVGSIVGNVLLRHVLKPQVLKPWEQDSLSLADNRMNAQRNVIRSSPDQGYMLPLTAVDPELQVSPQSAYDADVSSLERKKCPEDCVFAADEHLDELCPTCEQYKLVAYEDLRVRSDCKPSVLCSVLSNDMRNNHEVIPPTHLVLFNVCENGMVLVDHLRKVLCAGGKIFCFVSLNLTEKTGEEVFIPKGTLLAIGQKKVLTEGQEPLEERPVPSPFSVRLVHHLSLVEGTSCDAFLMPDRHDTIR